MYIHISYAYVSECEIDAIRMYIIITIIIVIILTTIIINFVNETLCPVGADIVMYTVTPDGPSGGQWSGWCSRVGMVEDQQTHRSKKLVLLWSGINTVKHLIQATPK